MSWTLRGGVTLCCRLLVIVQLLCLVVLVFAPPCLDCCYFFYLKSCLLFMRSAWLVAMVSLAVNWSAKDILLKEKFWYFPTVWWSLFCLVFCAFVAGKRIALCWIILKQNCKNLMDRCTRETLRFIIYLRGLNLKAGLASLGSRWRNQAPLNLSCSLCMAIPCSECDILFPLARPECKKRHKAAFWCVPQLRVWSLSLTMFRK